MIYSHYRQRTYTDTENNTVSERYTLYSPTSYRSVILEKDLYLDEISNQMYDTPLYYWIIGETNNIPDPFVRVKRGTTLKIPVI